MIKYKYPDYETFIESLLIDAVNSLDKNLKTLGFEKNILGKITFYRNNAEKIFVYKMNTVSIKDIDQITSFLSNTFSGQYKIIFLSNYVDRSISTSLSDNVAVCCVPLKSCFGSVELSSLMEGFLHSKDLPDRNTIENKLLLLYSSELLKLIKKLTIKLSVYHFEAALQEVKSLLYDEIQFNDGIIDILKLAGFNIEEHSNKPGYADIIIQEPATIVIEIKNDPARLADLDQVFGYSNFLNATYKAKYIPILVATEFPQDVVLEAKEQGIALLTIEKGFIKFLSLMYLVGRKAIYSLNPGLSDEKVQDRYNIIKNKIQDISFILNLLSKIGEVKLSRLNEAIINFGIHVKLSEVDDALNLIKAFPIKLFEGDEYVKIPPNILLHIIRILMFAGDII